MSQRRAPPPTASARTKRRYEDRNATEDDDLARFLQSQGQAVPENLLQQWALPCHSGTGQTSKHRRREPIHETFVPDFEPDLGPAHGPPSVGNSPRQPSPPPPPQESIPAPSVPLQPLQLPLPQPPEHFIYSNNVGLDSCIEDIKTSAELIKLLQNASLDDSGMSLEDIDRLRNPRSDKDPNIDPTDPAFILSLHSFLSCTDASEATYNGFRQAYLARHPDESFLSLYQIRRRIECLTGVVPLKNDMCVKSCIPFVGNYKDREDCFQCGEARHDPEILRRTGRKVPRLQFTTIPIGPVIQAFFQSVHHAELMQYFLNRLKILARDVAIPIYDDTCCGKEFVSLYRSGKIQLGDIVLQLSLDGAQLFRDKASDCWMYIYIIHNFSPDYRYKKLFVIPGGIIPGKPDSIEPFLFPGLYHISALQREGFKYYDAYRNLVVIDSKLLLAILSADGPAMATVSATVGHSGKYGCRAHCAMIGRRRAGDSHYYPAMLKPDNYAVDGCDHDDITFTKLREFRNDVPTRYRDNLFSVCTSANPRQYSNRHRESGIMKPCILDGLKYTIGVPNMFVMDLMHLADLNDPDLLLGLWRRQLKCYGDDSKDNWDWGVLVGKVWESHGVTVARCTPYLPSSFGRAPRDPSQKINSGYKAWEFLLYIYWLGPALLCHILPEKYWRNYCRLVRGMRLSKQFRQTPEDINESNRLLSQFVVDFENLYYQRNPDRLHFIRQSIHLLPHIPHETVRIGPLACYSQWAMETAIGNLGAEVRSLVDPYANLANRAVLRAQTNCLTAMYPHLSIDVEKALPQGARDLGNGYALLRPHDRTSRSMSAAEANALTEFWRSKEWPNSESFSGQIVRWGRAKLPNGQVARSVWSEGRSTRADRRRASIIKFSGANGSKQFAEIQYFFSLTFGEARHGLAMVSVYSPPDQNLLKKSFQTVYICTYEGETSLQVIEVVNTIESLVAMVPNFRVQPDGEIVEPENEFFLVERPSLEVARFFGFDRYEDDSDADDNGGDPP